MPQALLLSMRQSFQGLQSPGPGPALWEYVSNTSPVSNRSSQQQVRGREVDLWLLLPTRVEKREWKGGVASPK